MKLGEMLRGVNIIIMRALAPMCEAQRREFREARLRVEAYTEQLHRTIKEVDRAKGDK